MLEIEIIAKGIHEDIKYVCQNMCMPFEVKFLGNISGRAPHTYCEQDNGLYFFHILYSEKSVWRQAPLISKYLEVLLKEYRFSLRSNLG